MARAMRWVVPCVLLGLLASVDGAAALGIGDARTNAIAWLERNQNADGSWGSGDLQQIATAETLYALARAGRRFAASARSSTLVSRRYPSCQSPRIHQKRHKLAHKDSPRAESPRS